MSSRDGVLRVGVVGAGAIAPPYYMALQAWPQLDLVSCTSRGMDSASAAAAKYGIAAVSIEAMLADPAIDVVVNLTPIQAHYSIGMSALQSGKHLYSEKLLAQTVAEGQALLHLAQEKGLRIGCAPDTFFGSAHQEARAALDGGAIGHPVGASLFMGGGGVEAWHPFPEPFFAPGSGPVPDHAPYYITQLVHLLGPIAAVSGMGSRPSPVRTLRNPARAGQTITTEVDTTSVAILAMVSGQLVTVAMSWDMGPHARVPLEVYGSLGTLHNPDPNWSDGQVRIVTADGISELDHAARPFSRKTMITFQGNAVAYWRLCGLADMADAIAADRPHRASGELALHVLEVIEAIRLSSKGGQRIAIVSRCDRPAPIGDDIAHAHDVLPLGEELLDSRTLF